MRLKDEIHWLLTNSNHIISIHQDKEFPDILLIRIKLKVFFSTKERKINIDGQKELTFKVFLTDNNLVSKALYISNKTNEHIAHPYIEFKNKMTQTESYLLFEYHKNNKPLFIDFIIELMHILVFDLSFYSNDKDRIKNHHILYEEFREFIDMHSSLSFPLEKDILLENRFNQDKLDYKDVKLKHSSKKKNFKIVAITKKDFLSKIPFTLFSKKYIIDNYDYGQQNNTLFVTETACQEISEHIGWNRYDVGFNRVEQGGLLIGEVFEDNNIIYGIAHRAIAGNLAKGSATYLDMNHKVWKSMLERADELIEKNNNLHIIGWYHTHPNSLNVFMSGTDRNTHNKFFKESWHFAMVLNPHRKIRKVFNGKEVKEVNVYDIRKKNEKV